MKHVKKVILQENSSNCESYCPYYLVAKNKKCINCHPQYKFPNENFCRENIPIGSYIVQNIYNILENCFLSNKYVLSNLCTVVSGYLLIGEVKCV